MLIAKKNSAPMIYAKDFTTPTARRSLPISVALGQHLIGQQNFPQLCGAPNPGGLGRFESEGQSQ